MARLRPSGTPCEEDLDWLTRGKSHESGMIPCNRDIAMPVPNLFSYATSELSQDAMLCWMAACAAPDVAEADPQLHSLGKSFLAMIFAACGRPLPELETVEVKRQYKHIDILITVNSTTSICLEDKVGSVQHDDQLKRYRGYLEEDKITDVLPVYVQTYEQGSYYAVNEAGYRRVSRKALLDVLKPYAEQSNANDIVRDFWAHLCNIDAAVSSFRTRKLGEWEGLSWQGFFNEVQQTVGGEWGYVSNPAGGFHGHWWYFGQAEVCEPYLQLEHDALCFKLSVSEASARPAERERWYTLLREAATRKGIEIVPPRRRSSGMTMTVAKFPTDYRSSDGSGLLDVEATLAMLRRAEEVADIARALRSVGQPETRPAGG